MNMTQLIQTIACMTMEGDKICVDCGEREDDEKAEKCAACGGELIEHEMTADDAHETINRLIVEARKTIAEPPPPITVYTITQDTDDGIKCQAFLSEAERDRVYAETVADYWKYSVHHEDPMPPDPADAWDKLTNTVGFMDAMQTDEFNLGAPHVGKTHLAVVLQGGVVDTIASDNPAAFQQMVARHRGEDGRGCLRHDLRSDRSGLVGRVL